MMQKTCLSIQDRQVKTQKLRLQQKMTRLMQKYTCQMDILRIKN
jgi:hypothetical protein